MGALSRYRQVLVANDSLDEERQAAMPAKPGRSLDCFSRSNTIPNEVLEGGSGHQCITPRAVWRWPHQMLQEYIEQQKATL
jgi:hypothetical protein